jgi:methylenetetrahydrofolate reductase (NADPH)
VRDEADLRERIAALAAAGATEMLVLGGGAPQPIGIYDAAIQLLQTGVFQANGVKRIGIAGHPEGNPDITKIHGDAMLLKALQEKQAYLKANGLDGFIATQFLFEAGPVAEWAKTLRAAGIDLPIYVGVPGPATIKTLVKYAAMCGVGNSARFIRKQAMNITKLLSVNTPDEFRGGPGGPAFQQAGTRHRGPAHVSLRRLRQAVRLDGAADEGLRVSEDKKSPPRKSRGGFSCAV